MDVGRVLSRAWEITWRWKVLWILGFLAALGGSSPTANSSYQFSGQDFQSGRWPGFTLPPGAEGIVVALACLALVVGIALSVISVMARGGLIAGVAQVEDDGRTTLGRAWAAGQRRFWTLFGIGVLTVLPVLAVVAAMVVGIVAIAGGAAFMGAQGSDAVAPVITTLLACICPSVCLLVILGAVLAQIRLYAERAAVLEELGWIDAFRRGWQVLRENLGPTVILWIVFLVFGLVIAAIVLGISLPIVLPMAAFLRNRVWDTSVILPVCGLGLIATVVGAVISSVVTTFTSATWTLAYRQMTATGMRPVVTTTPDL